MAAHAQILLLVTTQNSPWYPGLKNYFRTHYFITVPILILKCVSHDLNPFLTSQYPLLSCDQIWFEQGIRESSHQLYLETTQLLSASAHHKPEQGVHGNHNRWDDMDEISQKTLLWFSWPNKASVGQAPLPLLSATQTFTSRPRIP